jgi:hypothetical protein
VWLDVGDAGAGPLSIARFTIIIPPNIEAVPAVVPVGTGGDDPVVGTLTGWVTNSSYTPGCDNFAFDIVLQSTCPCAGDIDADCDTDWSDLASMLANWGCMSPDPCYADLNHDGRTSVIDLAMLLADWTCPDGNASCDEPGPSVLAVAVGKVDNTSVEPGNDPLAPDFDGGITHFTFDLQVIADPYEDWGVAEISAELSAPPVQFFVHALDFGGYPPDPSFFNAYPALEFDSYFMAASVVEPGGSGLGPQLYWPNRTTTGLSALWFDFDDTGEGEFTIARLTFVVPVGGGIHPAVVPAGSGGENPLLGTISGWVTNTSLNPGCTEIAFDVIDCDCGGDIDGDCDTDIADLAELLATYGKCPGDDGYNPACNLYENDPPDGCVDLSDLALLLADYGCGG